MVGWPSVMFERLRSLNYDIGFQAHAEAILSHDFEAAVEELDKIVSGFRVSVSELIQGGGGEAGPTQRLRRALTTEHWNKHVFNITKTVDGRAREATSHIVDHVRQIGESSIALEIEWNNKDTFFDRDLENFKRLHIDSAISVGAIITRGRTFHDSLVQTVTDYCEANDIRSADDLAEQGIERTSRQQRRIAEYVRAGRPFSEAFARSFVSDKYGEATTHWRKLQERMNRGAGGSCPLVLIGWPRDILVVDPGVVAPGDEDSPS